MFFANINLMSYDENKKLNGKRHFIIKCLIVVFGIIGCYLFVYIPGGYSINWSYITQKLSMSNDIENKMHQKAYDYLINKVGTPCVNNYVFGGVKFNKGQYVDAWIINNEQHFEKINIAADYYVLYSFYPSLYISTSTQAILKIYFKDTDIVGDSGLRDKEDPNWCANLVAITDQEAIKIGRENAAIYNYKPDDIDDVRLEQTGACLISPHDTCLRYVWKWSSCEQLKELVIDSTSGEILKYGNNLPCSSYIPWSASGSQ